MSNYQMVIISFWPYIGGFVHVDHVDWIDASTFLADISSSKCGKPHLSRTSGAKTTHLILFFSNNTGN
jgi:hypothetical protein